VAHKLVHYCSRCGSVEKHRHVHATVRASDCAHGRHSEALEAAGKTHVDGSERFECTLCGHAVTARDREAARFPFMLDKVIHQPEQQK
jgi:hypothetical protein